MNVHVSYRLPKFPAIEKEFQLQIGKLEKRLQVFRPELVHLKGMVEEQPGGKGVAVSVNLRLPSGQMAAHSSAAQPLTAIKVAFEDLMQQLNKHKDLLRAAHRWNRGKRGAAARAGASVSEVPFESTVAAVFPGKISGDDIRSYVNVNLARLDRFVERAIYFREVEQTLEPGSVSKEEVIDEAIACALNDGQEKPEKMALEPWLYRQALRALDELSRGDETDSHAVHLEDSARRPNVKGSDEAELQFHQPDESILGESVIADHRVATPEQIMASDELLRLIANALRDIGPGPREAFILHAVEGFTVEEIGAITGLPEERVTTFVSAAREHLRKHPALAHQFSNHPNHSIA